MTTAQQPQPPTASTGPARTEHADETHSSPGLTNEELIRRWYQMVLARKIGERWFVLNRQGKAPFVITGQGHEATQVGTVAALSAGKDWVVPYYRDLGVALALGMTPNELMLNVFAKADDPNSGGRQMPAHWSHKRLRMVSGSSVVGTQLPIAAGLAWAAKLQGHDAVAVTYLGEGSTNQGEFHEGLNFAAVQCLPLVVVVENNGYAITEIQTKEMAITDVADRAQAYGVRGAVVDGNDLIEVHRAMQIAVQAARRGHGPTLLEAKTYRTVPHSSDDDDRRYRTREELDLWRARDPIDRLRKHLLEARILTSEQADELIAKAAEELRGAEAFAAAAPDPDPASLATHLYADSTTLPTSSPP